MRSQPHMIVVDIESGAGRDSEVRPERGLPGATLVALLTLVSLAVYVPAAVVGVALVAVLALVAHHLCAVGRAAAVHGSQSDRKGRR